MEPVETVNSIKLTKTERKVLVVLLTPREEEYCTYPPHGNDSAGIALQIWGSEARSPYSGQGDTLSYSAKTRISRTLNSLWRKGLVLRGVPEYEYGYFDCYVLDEPKPLHYRDLVLLRVFDYSGYIDYEIHAHSSDRHFKLPTNTKVWWMLSDNGTNITKEIAGGDP